MATSDAPRVFLASHLPYSIPTPEAATRPSMAAHSALTAPTRLPALPIDGAMAHSARPPSESDRPCRQRTPPGQFRPCAAARPCARGGASDFMFAAGLYLLRTRMYVHVIPPRGWGATPPALTRNSGSDGVALTVRAHGLRFLCPPRPENKNQEDRPNPPRAGPPPRSTLGARRVCAAVHATAPSTDFVNSLVENRQLSWGSAPGCGTPLAACVCGNHTAPHRAVCTARWLVKSSAPGFRALLDAWRIRNGVATAMRNEAGESFDEKNTGQCWVGIKMECGSPGIVFRSVFNSFFWWGGLLDNWCPSQGHRDAAPEGCSVWPLLLGGDFRAVLLGEHVEALKGEGRNAGKWLARRPGRWAVSRPWGDPLHLFCIC